MFSDYKTIFAPLGIVILIITSIIGRFIESDKSKIRKFVIGNFVIEIISLESIAIAIIGLYSMLQLKEGIDLVWAYFLVFNLFLISQVSIRVYKKE